MWWRRLRVQGHHLLEAFMPTNVRHLRSGARTKIFSTIKVYLAEISACHVGFNWITSGAHPLTMRLLKGVRCQGPDESDTRVRLNTTLLSGLYRQSWTHWEAGTGRVRPNCMGSCSPEGAAGQGVASVGNSSATARCLIWRFSRRRA